MRATAKKAIKNLLGHFGWQRGVLRDAFDLQRTFIQTKEPVVIDIGAHIGDVANLYRKLFPLASIHAFEPFPESFEILSKRVTGDSRIFCHNKAVNDKEGSATLNSNIFSPTNSLLASDERGSSFWGEGLLDTTSQVEVATTTVDIFCRDTGISHIDILKMDVQGAEYSVLTGAKEMLSNQRVSLIYTEIIMCPTYKGQQPLHEYLSLLDSFGYYFLDFFNQVRIHDQLVQADVLFLSFPFRKDVEQRLWNI